MAIINIPRICEFCKNTFYSKHRHNKFCSHNCYSKKKTTRTLRERLYQSIEKTEYCWIWKGSINGNGYGRVFINGKHYLAHRLIYKLETQEDITNKVVRHFVCDNPPCVNPAHLMAGTHSDNSQDMVNKNRHPHGETSYAKLTEQDVVAIRKDTRTQQAIADAYGVARRTIGHIKNKTTWKHLA